MPEVRIDGDFWSYLDELVASSKLVIDRPRGSAHPRFPQIVCPLDYGYPEGTSAGDGGGIDVWLGSFGTRDITGVACTVDLCKRDAEVGTYFRLATTTATGSPHRAMLRALSTAKPASASACFGLIGRQSTQLGSFLCSHS